MALNTTRYYNYAIFFSDGSLAGFLYFLYWYTIIRVGGLDFFFHTYIYIYILWEFHNPKWQTHSIIQRGSYGTVVLLFSVFGTLIIPWGTLRAELPWRIATPKWWSEDLKWQTHKEERKCMKM